jgi:hypothetical protein
MTYHHVFMKTSTRAIMAALRTVDLLLLFFPMHHCSSANENKVTGARFVIDEDLRSRTAVRAYTLFP